MEQTNGISRNEKNRIKLEELYRHEIKKELEYSTMPKNKLWSFLNSSFGLFIFSGVLVTGITNFVSSQYQQRAQKAELRVEALKHLTELDYRISQIEILLTKIDTAEDNSFKVSSGVILTWYITADDTRFAPSDEQFKNTHLLAIISWFKYRIDGLKTIDQAYEMTKTFEDLKDDKWFYDVKKSRITLNSLIRLNNEINNVLEKW